MINLTGKIILVTGSSSGIGAAIAVTLAKAGAAVILHYNNSEAGALKVAAEIGSNECQIVRADLTEEKGAIALWEKAVAWQGKIDIIVNNAGIYIPATIEDDFDTWTQVWQKTLQVNLIAVGALCREAVRHFQSRGGGTIINIASRAAFRGDDVEHIHYAASKGGVVALTRTIARGFAKDNILAYTVAPGFVRTEKKEATIKERGEEAFTGDIPLGKIAEPQDVANTVAFLASGLAPHATGTTIDINGASYVR